MDGVREGEDQHMMARAEHIAETQRELDLRRQCYPAWVQSGKLDAGAATYHIRVMEEIVCSLMALEEIVRTLLRLDAEQRQLSLFGDRA
jgi:hypothetical protein